MSRFAYLAFFVGFIGSGIHRGMPVLDLVAGTIFMAIMFFFANALVGILRGTVVTPGSVLEERERLRKEARGLRNRPGAMNTDLTGIKQRNKGHTSKHLRWVKK